MSGLLTDSQRESLTLFMEISQIQDEGLCMDILQTHSFNVDNAVNAFLGGGGGGDQDDVAPTSSVQDDYQGMGVSGVGLNNRGTSSGSSGSSSSSSSSRSNNNRGSSSSSGTGGTAMSGSRIASSNISNGNANASGSTQGPAGGILDFVLNPLKWIFQARQLTINPDQETRLFLSDFERRYSDVHPEFHGRSYKSAVREAFRESKFLIIYLHSPLHENTDQFCQQVICKREVADYCNRSAVTWAGSVWDTEAYELSHQLRVATYPFVAMLMCRSEGMAEVVDRYQGTIEAGSLLNRLRNVMLAFQTNINSARVQQQRRRADSILREEQDRDFRETEAQDRANRERREREAAESRAREEEVRVQREREAAVAEEVKATMQRRVEQMQAEPTTGTDVATVRFQLPNGSKVTRRFEKGALIRSVYDWLEVHLFSVQSETTRFSISTAHPKVELKDEHLDSTVESVGLFPRGMLYVQDLDL